MSAQGTKTGVAAKTKKAAPAYEMVVDETGALRRVPVARTGIVTAAVQGSAAAARLAPPPPPPPAQEVEEELVFDESGEELTGDARAKALANAAARNAAALQAKPAEENEEELVFNNSGELLTGNARRKAIEEAAAAVVVEPPPKPSKAPRKTAKAVAVSMETADLGEKIKMFYRFRAKDPEYFTYTAEGNLEVKADNPKGVPASVISMRAFGPLRPEELEELETKQREAQQGIEESYVVKLRELREANEAYIPGNVESATRVVRANQELRDVSVARAKILYPEQWVKTIESVDTKVILLDQPHEERKMGYPIHLYKRFSLSHTDAEGHYRAHGEGEEGGMAGGGTVVLFLTNPEDPQTGHFHPAAEREFVYNETKYASPYQAYEAERFKQLEDDEMVKKLLGTRSAKTIKNLVSMEPRQPQHPLQLWEDILETMYTQFKDALENLKETGSARFHMMDKQIGSVDYANALANVRTKLKERENDAPGMIDEVKKAVISEEQQKKAKVGAIINNFRRFH